MYANRSSAGGRPHAGAAAGAFTPASEGAALDRGLARTYGRPITTAISPDDPAYAGQARYTAGFLRVYDTVVLRLNGHLAWRCPPQRLVQLYDEHVTALHLDIGVGTGYLLDKCRYPTQSPDITLMDLNPTPLEVAAKPPLPLPAHHTSSQCA